MTEAPESQDTSVAAKLRALDGDFAAKSFFVLSAAYLVFGVFFGSISAIKLVDPALFGAGILPYGRLQPMVTTALVYGWLSMGLVGAMFYITPRVCGIPLLGGPIASLNSLLWAGVVFAGIGAVGADMNAGRPLMEFPVPVAGGLVVSGGVNAALILGTIAQRREKQIFPSLWYFAGATIWFPLLFIVGWAPIYAGIGQATQTGFFVQGLLGLWLVAGGIGILYYLIPRITGNPLYSRRLALIGFWTLAVFWIFTGQVHYVLSPGAPSAQSVAIAFAFCVAIPIWTTLANLAGTVRGRWGCIGDSAPLRCMVAGGVFLFVYSIALPLGALRSVNQITGLTAFSTGSMYLLLLGAVGLWVVGSVYFIFPKISGRLWISTKAQNWQLGLQTVGVTAVALATWSGGLVQGFITTSAASSARPVSAGEAWEAVAMPMKSFDFIALIGVALFATAAAVYVAGLFRTALSGEPATVEVLRFEEGEFAAGPVELIPEDVRDRALLPVVVPLASLVFIGVIAFPLSRILLALEELREPRFATAFALVVAGLILGGCALASAKPKLPSAALGGAVTLFALVIVAGGAFSMHKLDEHRAHEAAAKAAAEKKPEDVVAISAKNIAFDTDRIDFTAGHTGIIDFDNQDVVEHNVSIYEDSTLREVILRGKLIKGGEKIRYTFDVPPPGDYYFHCDVHPNMFGTAVVAPAPEVETAVARDGSGAA